MSGSNLSANPLENKCIICLQDRIKKDRNKSQLCDLTKAQKLIDAFKKTTEVKYEFHRSIKTPQELLANKVLYHPNCMRKFELSSDRSNCTVTSNSCSNLNDHSENASGFSSSNDVYEFSSDDENEENSSLNSFKSHNVHNRNDIRQKKMTAIKNAIESVLPQVDAGEILQINLITKKVNQTLGSEAQIHNRDVKSFMEIYYNDSIDFTASSRSNESTLFFKSSLTRDDLIRKLASIDVIKESAQLIRKSLLAEDFDLNDKFCDKFDLQESWNRITMPTHVERFFSVAFDCPQAQINKSFVDITSSNVDADNDQNSANLNLRIKSLYQMMVFTLHGGRKRTPLHMLTGISVHSICKSASLITSLNRIGVSMSYDDIRRTRSRLAAFTIERSMGNVPIPSHFDPEEFTVAAFDNFDHNENTLSGLNSSHDTVFVLFQNRPKNINMKPKINETEISKVNKTLVYMLDCQKLKSFEKPDKITLSPEFQLRTLPNIDPSLYQKTTNDILWVLSRVNICEISTSIPPTTSIQMIPSWAAFNSLLTVDLRPTQIAGYLPVLPFPVTEYSTVYTSLCNFKNVLTQLKQDCLPVFCDEGVYRIARHIKFERSEEFADIFVMLGSFHMAKVGLTCIGKYLKGSGIEQVLIETETFGPGTTDQVLSGTNYSRSFNGFTLVSEALQRLQLKEFLKTITIDKYSNDFSDFSTFRDLLIEESHDEARAMYQLLETKSSNFRNDFEAFIVKSCSESSLFLFWNNVIVMTDLVKNLIKADRTGDWDLHVETVIKLQPLFHAMDRTNYSRWSSVYIADIINLQHTSPDLYKHLKAGHFTVKQSNTPFTSIAVDQGLECSINRSGKDSGGIIGSTAKKDYVTTWNLVYHEELDIKNLFRQLTLVDEDNYELYHHEFSSSCTKTSELLVSNIVKYIEKYTNPFLIQEDNSLRNIITQEKCSDIVSHGLLKIWDVGCNTFKNFYTQRILLQKEDLSETIKKIKLKTMDFRENQPKKQLKPKLDDLKEAQQVYNLAVERQYPRESLFSYQLSANNMLFNNEGSMNAAVNSQLIDELKKQVKIQDSSTNAVDTTTCLIFRTLDLCRKIKFKNLKTFQDYREQFTELLLVEISCKPQLTRIDLLFECFQQKLPTTEVISNKQSFEIHSIGDETPIPSSESNFWNNSENVKLLQVYLIEHLEKSIPTLVRQHEKLKIFSNIMPNSAAYDMNDECIAHIQSATKNKHTEIKITYADCDLLVMVMYFWKNFEMNGLKKLWMEYKCGRSTKIIPVEILVQNYNQSFRQVLPAMHFLTGSFYTSKIGTKLKAIEANPLKYLENFATDVQQLDLGDILKAAETYLVRVLYKKETCETFNDLRVSLFKSGKITVITELPPCSEEITYHIRRAYYITYNKMWMFSSEKNNLDPVDFGYQQKDQKLVPKRVVSLYPPIDELPPPCHCKNCSRKCNCRMNGMLCCSFCKCVNEKSCQNYIFCSTE